MSDEILPSHEQPAGTRRDRRRSRGSSMILGVVIALLLGSSGGVLVQRLSSAAASEQTVPLPAPLAPLPTEPDLPRRIGPAPAEPVRSRPQRDPAECGRKGASTVAIRVAVDGELRTTRREFARAVMRILCHERSWIAGGAVRFRYDPEAPVLVALRSPAATQRRCLQLTGLSVQLKYSCASRASGEAVINADRWFGGSPTWDGTVARYRHMVINHEVGHLLGQHHRGCPAPGRRAPVMMQQSKGTGGCQPNPWPLRSEIRTIR